MSKSTNQNAEVYQDMMTSGKSLLQLYVELKEKYRGVKPETVIHGVDQHFPPRADQQKTS
jgi:hypothetical protein